MSVCGRGIAETGCCLLRTRASNLAIRCFYPVARYMPSRSRVHNMRRTRMDPGQESLPFESTCLHSKLIGTRLLLRCFGLDAERDRSSLAPISRPLFCRRLLALGARLVTTACRHSGPLALRHDDDVSRLENELVDFHRDRGRGGQAMTG